ncbi:MAG TPA: ATP-binding protein, partial [Solirubrobacteraceae bacterium]|nr:ATP-binding protein [Solirubrobacteraceae bacterium]
PGSGKTTALVGISKLLAQIGIVPVVVSLGDEVPRDMVELAKQRFETHARGLLGDGARLAEVWEWLRDHRRVVVLADDMDRIAPDGERGFLVRRGLIELAGEGLPAVVTARPAGIPAGLAASAIDLQRLDEGGAVAHVLRAARKEHGVAVRRLRTPEVRGNVKRWVEEGGFAEVPFYLELLARLVAAGRCEDLAQPHSLESEAELAADPRVHLRADGRCEWNPLWVRFQLLQRFYDEVEAGRVRRWLGIEERERKRCLEALSEAALSTLAASGLEVLPKYKRRDKRESDLRVRIEAFLDPDDRSSYVAERGERRAVSAHEVVETAERLYMLDRDPDGKLLFKHRILHAYLAGRCLAGKLDAKWTRGEHPPGRGWEDREPFDWLGALLDSRHPDRLTARMALTFAALFAYAGERPEGGLARIGIDRLLERLVDEAGTRVKREFGSKQREMEWEEGRRERRLDPRRSFHQEGYRIDPDDGLSILTTAAEIAGATGRPGWVPAILRGVKQAAGATRWTKMHAIPVLASLRVVAAENATDGGARLEEIARERWTRIWEFARDPDEAVSSEAGRAIADDAMSAYRALEEGIEALLAQAALKSARDMPLDVPRDGAGYGRIPGGSLPATLARYGIEIEKHEVDSLCALGWVLPAIVSGLREQPRSRLEHGFDGAPRATAVDEPRASGVEGGEPDGFNPARPALERLVALAFQGGHPDLEASVARGFKSDAMRHLDYPEQARPGFVDSNRRLVSDICIDHARYWYARMVLHQTLALYTIAGSSAQVALDTYGRLLHRGAEPHPFARRAAMQARRAVFRSSIGTDRWEAFIWRDEVDAVGRRQASMNPVATHLVADVALLLNLRQNVSEDRRAQSSGANRLPHCLSRSKDRLEILGAGCPRQCGSELCPLTEAPVDEPDGKRTISRAFCRGQQRVAKRRRPPWQGRIRKEALREFWTEMEQRART